MQLILTVLAVFAVISYRAHTDIFGKNISPAGNLMASTVVLAWVGMADT